MHADQSVTDDKVTHTCCIFVRALHKSCIDKFLLNVDHVYDNVYTKIGLNKSIHSQDIKN